MSTEPSSGSERETDISIAVELPTLTIRCAIECRDHKPAQDITWIDELIGKYASLKFDKVIAVSKSGFTANALKKAAAANIDCRTLEEALEKDWSDFKKLGIAYVSHVVQEATISLTFMPPVASLADEDEFVTESGKRLSAAKLKSDIERLAEIEVGKTIGRAVGNTLKTLGDLERPCVVEIERRPQELVWLMRDGVEHHLVRFVYRATLKATNEKAVMRHQRYPDALVSTAEGPGPGEPTLAVVQGKDRLARLLSGPELDVVKEFDLTHFGNGHTDGAE